MTFEFTSLILDAIVAHDVYVHIPIRWAVAAMVCGIVIKVIGRK